MCSRDLKLYPERREKEREETELGPSQDFLGGLPIPLKAISGRTRRSRFFSSS